MQDWIMRTALIILLLLTGCATPQHFYYEKTICVQVGIGDPETIKDKCHDKRGCYRPGENRVMVPVDEFDINKTRLVWGDEFLHAAGVLGGEHRIKE